jgi:hypothetical protein
MTLQRNASPARQTAPPGAQDGMGTRATGKRSPSKMWDRTPPPLVRGTRPGSCPRGWSPGRGGAGWAEVAYLLWPGSAQYRGATDCAVAGASRRISQVQALGATRLAPAGRRSVVLSSRVPEPVQCDQELKLLCKELRRRAGAGRRPRGGDSPLRRAETSVAVAVAVPAAAAVGAEPK